MRIILAFFLAIQCAIAGASQINLSQYKRLTVDTCVTGTNQTLLQTTISLPAADTVYIQSDGNMWPAQSARTMGLLYILVDGARASNDAVVDWPANQPNQHSFSLVAATTLSAGTHTISLIGAELTNNPFYIGQSSNLSVMVHPAASVLGTGLYDPSNPYGDYLVANRSVSPTTPIDTSGWRYASPTPLNGLEPLSLQVPPTGSPVVAMSAGRVYGGWGDVLTGIQLNHANPGNGVSSWAVNDMGNQAENQAPVSNHAYFSNMASGGTVSLLASVFPWGSPTQVDTIQYYLSAGTQLIALYGGLQVSGSAPISTALNNPWDAVCVNVPSSCSRSVLTNGYFTIPYGHPGVVMFSAKTRVQDQIYTGEAGWATIRIAVYNSANTPVGYGSIGAQHISDTSSISQRTLTSSYLAAGSSTLPPGNYRVAVEISTWGELNKQPLNSLVFRSDMPLLWFD